MRFINIIVLLYYQQQFKYTQITNNKQYSLIQHTNIQNITYTIRNMQLSTHQQPQILHQLREQTLNINLQIEKYTAIRKNAQKIATNLNRQLNKINQEKEVQKRKNKSFIVLLNQLEQVYYQNYLGEKVQGLYKNSTQSHKLLQLTFLRHLLIKQTQNNKQLSKLLSFLKQVQLDKNKTKAQSFIKKSNFIQNQSQLIAKLHFQLTKLKNDNLQCPHKWYQLEKQKQLLQNKQKLYKVQIQRQKYQLKQQYQQYLSRMNQAKGILVTYNQLRNQSTITQYFVKQIAILQQKRIQYQNQSLNLKYHYQNLLEEFQRISVESRQLNQFFEKKNNNNNSNNNSNNNQQNLLANKMKKRIEELRDILIEYRKKNKDTRSIKLTKILQYLQQQYINLKQSNKYMQVKLRDQQDHGLYLQQKPIVDFFTKILQQKDQQNLILKQRQNSLKDQRKQLEIKKQLLEGQIGSLEENVKVMDYQTKYYENNNGNSVISGNGNNRRYGQSNNNGTSNNNTAYRTNNNNNNNTNNTNNNNTNNRNTQWSNTYNTQYQTNPQHNRQQSYAESNNAQNNKTNNNNNTNGNQNNEDWRKIARQTNQALGMQTYFEGSFK